VNLIFEPRDWRCRLGETWSSHHGAER